MIKPVEIEFLIKNGTRGTLEKITADVLKVGSDGSQSAAGASVAFEKAKLQAVLLQDVIENLEDKLKSMQSPDIDQTDNIADIENLKDKIDELKSHLLQVQEASENTQVVPPSMNVAQKKFDGLHFSIQQIAREMPTLAMGPQMFFMAISNNLPIFSDELARAKREYAELIKTGQKGTPVWKQVVKSLLSWQTAMTTGIMLLVMYGDKIVKSISDMTGWGVAARKKKEAAEQLAEAEKKMVEQTANNVTQMEALSRAWFQLGNDMNAKITFINENASAFNKLGISINNVADAENLLIRNKQAFIDAQFAKAEGAVLAEMAATRYKDVLEKQKTLDAVPKAYVQEKGTYTDGYGNKKTGMVMRKDSSWQKAEDELKDAEKAYNDIMNKVVEKQGKASEILKNANFNTIDEIKEGTIAWYEEQISLKQKHLKTLSVNDTAEIKELNKQIADYQAIIDKATGKSSGISTKEKEYNKDKLSSLKDAREAELALERSAINDKIKLIEFERDAKVNAINAEKQAYVKKYGNKADTSGFDRQINAINKQADSDIQEQTKENIKAEMTAMQDYLKEYGTFQQKKYAVAQEYARKIQEAQNEGERLTLEKELASYNSKLQADDLKMNIDWSTVFGGFGGIFSDMVKPVLEDAKKYITTDNFKNSDEASKEALIEAIGKMEKSLSGSGGLNFKQLGTDMQAYQNSLIALNEAKALEIEAVEKLTEAQKEYNQAVSTGIQANIDIAKGNLDAAQSNANTASKNVQSQINIANQTQATVNETASQLQASMSNVTDGLSKIASGSLSGAYEGLIQASKGFGGVMEKIADKLESVPIIGWIVSIIDLFKDGLSLLVGGLLDAIFNAISGIIGDILSGDIFVTIAESISKGIVNIVKSIVTMGGLFGFLDDESDKNLQADLDRLTASNERLEEALNRLSEKMDDAATSQATSVYKEQLDNVKNREQNTQEMMQREGAAWARFGYGFAGLGGKSSSNHFINKGISGSEWDTISQIVGKKVSGAGDFWGLSSEEMAKVADEAGWIYDKIKGYADDGHKDASKYMDEYISYAKEREELEKAYYEKLTSTSFDSVRDEFKNTLLDMSSDAEDFATNFEKMMQNAIIESMMTETYDKKLKEWYKAFGDAMEDGSMSQGEKDSLQSNYNKIVQDAIAERNALKDAMGWDDDSSTTQSGKSGSFETMSQDQGTKLEGLFTASEMRIANIEETTESVDVQMSVAVSHLEKIEENTARCADELKEIKEDIKRINNDGLKVK